MKLTWLEVAEIDQGSRVLGGWTTARSRGMLVTGADPKCGKYKAEAWEQLSLGG